MSLWMHWWNAVWRLRPAFSRLQTFLWFATAVAGFTVRTDMLGVTSIVRALNLDARCYYTAGCQPLNAAVVSPGSTASSHLSACGQTFGYSTTAKNFT